jgi:hypothetical protein
MKYLPMLHIAMFYLIVNQYLISQNCKFAKDEIDPFKKKNVVLSKSFDISTPPLVGGTRNPTLHSHFIFENNSIYFKLQSIIIVSGGILTNTDYLKQYIKFKENKYISIKFQNNDNLLKIKIDYQSQVLDNRSSGMIT